MNILVVDVETTINASTSSKSTPFSSLNKIVAIGYRKGYINQTHFSVSFDAINLIYLAGREQDHNTTLKLRNFFSLLQETQLLIGHNMGGFDLNWLRRLSEEGKKEKEVNRFTLDLGRFIQLWDTQIAEYLLSGQSMISPSLDEVATLYNLPLKDSAIKQYWAAGIPTDQIPMQELLDYLEHDVLVTSKIFMAQLAAIGASETFHNGIFNIMPTQMLARLATAEMEWNGMYFDKERANKYREELSVGLDMLTVRIKLDAYNILKDLGNTEEGLDFNPASPKDIKLLLYGGVDQVERDVPVLDEKGNQIIYKSGIKRGKVKTRKEKVSIKIQGALPVDVVADLVADGYEVDTSEDTLRKILKLLKSITVLRASILSDIEELIKDILEYRSIAKEISTYLIGYSLEVQDDGCIHTSYNHTITRTGRLSSSKPNLQNISSKSHDI